MAIVSIYRVIPGEGQKVAECVWMDDEKNAQRGNYSVDLLELASRDETAS
jgi:hypothetical protein